MLIPSIDLMGGKIVQLVQGSRKELEFDNFEEWIERFSKYPLVQVIDLDAAMGQGQNRKLVKELATRLPCQVGGGIRTIDAAGTILRDGARRVIFGSALISQGRVDCSFARQAAEELGVEKIVAAVDSRAGKVAVKGWTQISEIRAADMVRLLEPYCTAFLYTHIDTEGLLAGIPLDVIRELRRVTSRQLIAAGGIRSEEEIAHLDTIGVDAVVGMAIYRGLIPA
ncbi:MAG TPA: 1-(5-phosphoribosyl)-5-[(5-phosphoribosylamino)methylideneamino] imidazole-4-carboxamide isomerase [Candidatus Solibacter sp.]|nr:1-(5-phosphoribosyl)-5-[(5-phosphoribosylamino)methylideneamino] imidazole-4-carboxamide isomerase [Candidatus Solibacter sp.]